MAKHHDTVEERDAADLAALLTRHPSWTNELHHLDDLERAEGCEPTPWVRPPADLLAEAQSHMVREVGDDGNYVV